MTDAQVLEIAIGAIEVSAKLSAPIMLATLAIGVVVSVLQAVTQVQEMTLTFVPKLIGAALIVVLGGNWMIRELVTWVERLWTSIPSLL